MKKLTIFFSTMALTLMLSSVAFANFLGMEPVNEYHWTYDTYQSFTTGDGTTASLSLDSAANFQADLTALFNQGESVYLWGIMDLESVSFKETEQNVWQLVGGNTVDPRNFVGVYSGLQVVGIDDDDQLLFAGGHIDFYAGSVWHGDTIVQHKDTAGQMVDGVLDVAWFETEYETTFGLGVDPEILLSGDWATNTYDGPGGLGVFAASNAVTQYSMVNFGSQSSFKAQGNFFVDFDDSTTLGDMLDSDRYGTFGADLDGSVANLVVDKDLGWHFRTDEGGADVYATPEPSTFLLIGAGLLGCFFYTRRRNA